MAGKDRVIRTGNQTKRIYPSVAKALLVMRETQSLAAACRKTSMTPESISQCLRNVEIKLNVRLFHRHRGRGVRDWIPILPPQTTEAWERISQANVDCS